MIGVQIGILALTVAVVAIAVRLLRVWPPIPRRRAPTPHPPALPAELERCEKLVAGGLTADRVHRELRPMLREIAAARLLSQGVRLDLDPDRAAAILGEPLWELTRPGRPAPTERFAAGISNNDLNTVLERLEAL